MNRHKLLWWLGLPAMVLAGPMVARTSAQEAPAYADPEGVQVLNRGPIHEAFAGPVIYDPKPSPVIAAPPPEPIEELPPDQKPEGDSVQWIPGYWAWDDARSDYIWLSGIWRDVPPDRQWVPGYWSQVDGGYQWTPGAWVSTDQSQVQYLPAPPQSLEVGPSSPAPSADATWAPGYWSWQDSRYAWRPGFWVPFQQDWVWVPAHYMWTPSGYLFVNGYWDRPLLRRGLPFAPVVFTQPVYRQPNFRYTPTIGLVTAALASSLFVRPANQQYYFGDYYAPNNFQSGIYPWYSFHQSRYGYDPLFSHYSAVRTRRDPQWVNNLHEEYRYRRDHPDARPPQTFARQQAIVNNRINNVTNITNTTQQVNNNTTQIQNLVMARPIGQIAARGGSNDASALRFERLDEARRRNEAKQAAQLQEFRQARLKQEREAARRVQANQARIEPRRFEFPRSPVTAAVSGGAEKGNQGRRPQRIAPPPLPTHPRADLNARPPVAGQFRPGRPDPHPDQLPPQFRRNQADGRRPGQPDEKRREVLRPPLQQKQQEFRKVQPPPAAKQQEFRKVQPPPAAKQQEFRKVQPPPAVKSAIEKGQAQRADVPKRVENIQPPAASRFRPGQIPTQFRRNQADGARPGQPNLERREILRTQLQKQAQESRKIQPLPAASPAAEKRQAPRPDPKKRSEPRKDQKSEERRKDR